MNYEVSETEQEFFQYSSFSFSNLVPLFQNKNHEWFYCSSSGPSHESDCGSRQIYLLSARAFVHICIWGLADISF
jgi:hypothetical protein